MKNHTKVKKNRFVGYTIIITILWLFTGIVTGMLAGRGIIKNKRIEKLRKVSYEESSNSYITGNRNGLDIIETGANENNTAFYIKCMNGLIYQWGITEDFKSDIIKIQFPIAFSNNEYSLELNKTIDNAIYGMNMGINLKEFNRAELKVIEDSILPENIGVINWVAIGY